MTITRLSGGLTPANGADPRTFPAIWNATATDIETAESEIDTLQAGIVSLGTSTGGTASLNFTTGEVLRSHQVSGTAITVSATGYTPGSTRTLRILGGTAVASLTTPSGWVFVGNAPDATIGTATTVVVTATSFGTAASNVVAAFAKVQ